MQRTTISLRAMRWACHSRQTPSSALASPLSRAFSFLASGCYKPEAGHEKALHSSKVLSQSVTDSHTLLQTVTKLWPKFAKF